jgi:MFS superfamily sulfate permease-like transporter
MLGVGACIQLAGLHPGAQKLLKALPRAVSKGFLFTTAVGILFGLVKSRVAGCLSFDFWPTALVYTASLVVAVGWTRFCHANQTFAKFKVLGLLLGLSAAWVGTVWLLPGATSANGCGTMGGAGLQWQMVWQRVPAPGDWRAAAAGLSLAHWCVVALVGVLLGLVQLIESLTTLTECLPDGADPHAPARYLRCTALVNLCCAPLGLACSSYSTSRSKTAKDAEAQSRWTAGVHGVALLGVSLVAADWIGRAPVLAIAVALTMVGVAMIDDGMEERVWRPAYAPGAHRSHVQAGWLFWLVVGVTLVIGMDYAIVGLLAAAIVARWSGFQERPVPNPP